MVLSEDTRVNIDLPKGWELHYAPEVIYNLATDSFVVTNRGYFFLRHLERECCSDIMLIQDDVLEEIRRFCGLAGE